MQEGFRLLAAAGFQAGLRLWSSENEQEEYCKQQLCCCLTLQTHWALPGSFWNALFVRHGVASEGSETGVILKHHVCLAVPQTTRRVCLTVG